MKINFSVKNKVIDNLMIDNENIIMPWGLETADSYGFFSLEDGSGYRYNIEDEKFIIKDNLYEYNISNHMPEGKWVIKGTDSLNGNIVNRKVELLCLEDTILMDFVLRYRFKKKYFDYAIIDNKVIKYQYSNVYNQYPVEKIELFGEKFKVTLKIKDKIIPEGMKPYMYVRDSNTDDEWIVHVRMLPVDYEKIVIKLCNKWYKTQPINQKIANILLKNNKIKKYLSYRNEREPYKNFILKRINPNAFKMIRIKKNTNLMWDVDCIFEKA